MVRIGGPWTQSVGLVHGPGVSVFGPPGQRVAHITQVACFQSALKVRRFICPKMFFSRCLVEVIVLSRSLVSLCKAMYQSAFLSLEFSPNWVVGNDRC